MTWSMVGNRFLTLKLILLRVMTYERSVYLMMLRRIIRPRSSWPCNNPATKMAKESGHGRTIYWKGQRVSHDTKSNLGLTPCCNYLIPPSLDNQRHVESKSKRHRNRTHLDGAISLDTLEPPAIGFQTFLAQNSPANFLSRLSRPKKLPRFIKKNLKSN